MVSSYEQQQIPLQRIKENPGLKDLLDMAKKDIFLSLNCHAIGTIKEFDVVKQVVKVTINYSRVFYNKNPDGTYSDVLIPYPILMDCPIITLTGGNACLTFPITAGDTCLVFFNDRNFQDWFTSGNAGLPPASGELHAIGDAIALVGLRSTVGAVTAFDQTRAALRKNNTTVVAVSDSHVRIQNATQNLNTLLQNLSTQLENLCTAINAITVGPGTFSNGGGPVVGISGAPLNAASISSISTQISSIATNIGNLLD